MTSDADPRREKLDAVIAEYLQAVEAGTAASRETLLAQHPELAEQLQAFFDQLDEQQHVDSETTDAPSEGVTIPPTDAPTDDATISPGEATIEIGTRLRYFGDYELLEEIARGGMGVVYKAKQVSLNRIVALKMILAGQLASEEDVQRFHAEAEAAANLDYPGIVPIHEVGVHDAQHYFSMGYVEGSSLAERIADGPLPPREAAELTKKVAEAVAYAHEHGVIHRDLKPANVLLDEHGQPRVTDFGLAKRVQGDSDLTRSGQIIGTPSYMPPEQASGKIDDIRETADVYALGAILYCLLTGRPPFQADNQIDTLMQVLEQEPVGPRVLNPKIPKDLETICLKCLQKEPHRRYGSSDELAVELQRFLNGEPILARPIGTLARTWRWCRRKPIVAGLLGATAGSLLVGVIVSSYFAILARQRAEDAFEQKTLAENALKAESEANARTQLSFVAMMRARNQARQAVDNYVDLVTTDEVLGERRFQPLRRRLLSDATTYYQTLVDQSDSNSTTQLDMAMAWRRLGQVHDSSGTSRGGYDAAQQAVTAYRNLLRNDSQSVDLADQLTGTLNLLAHLALDLSKTSEAIEYYDEAIRIDRELVDRFPEETDYWINLARDHNNLGEARRHAKDIKAAEQSYLKAIEIKQRLVQSDPDNDEYLSSLGNSYNNLGILADYDPTRSSAALEQAIAIRQKMVQRHPDDTRFRANLADSYFNLGNLLKDRKAALVQYEKAQEIHEQLLQEAPNVAEHRFRLAKTLLNSGETQARLGDTAAQKQLLRAVELLHQLIAEQPDVPEYEYNLSACHDGLAIVSISRNDVTDAVQQYKEALSILRKLAQAHPDRIRYRDALAFAYYRLGDVTYNRVGNPAEALEYWQAEAELRRDFVRDFPDRSTFRFYLGGTLNNAAMAAAQLGQFAEAARLYEEAARHQRIALDADPQRLQRRMFLSNHYFGLCSTNRALGRLSKAASAIEKLAELWPDDAQRLYFAAAEMAKCACGDETLPDGQLAVADEETVESIRHSAVEILEKAIAAGFADISKLVDDEVWEAFQDDDRFQSVTRKISSGSAVRGKKEI